MIHLKTLILGEKSDTLTLGVRMLSPRMTPLDEIRSSSMADEGGAAASLDDDDYYLLKKNGHGKFTLLGRYRSLSTAQTIGISLAAVGVGLGFFWIRAQLKKNTLAAKGN